MTTANQEKVCACDYCGSDYTDAKYCCAARREYLNAHGEFETGRAPAASVGDAPSDAVAWELSYPHEMPAYELVGAPEFVRSEAHAEKIAAGCESHYGKRATYRALYYTAPPAAPVVSGNTPEARMFASACEALASVAEALGLDEHADPDDMLTAIQEGRSASGSEAYQSLLSAVHEAGFRVAVDDGGTFIVEEDDTLSVPATDDKAPAVDAEAVAWRYRVVTNSGARGEWFFSADETKTEGCIEAEPLYAAPTSPHDVDAVRVDEAMVERASEAHAAYLNDETRFDPCNRCKGKGYHHGFGEDGADPDWCEECGGPGQIWNGTDEGAMRAALTAALRKPGGA